MCDRGVYPDESQRAVKMARRRGRHLAPTKSGLTLVISEPKQQPDPALVNEGVTNGNAQRPRAFSCRT